MKIFLLLMGFFISSSSFSQDRSIEVYIEVSDRVIDYGHLKEWLPDSMHHIFVRLDSLRHSTGQDLVNILSFYGWKLISTELLPEPPEQVFFGSRKYLNLYIMSRKIVLRNEDYQAVLQKMKKEADQRKDWNFY